MREWTFLDFCRVSNVPLARGQDGLGSDCDGLGRCSGSQGLDDAALRNGSTMAPVDELPQFTV
jgi:hypothetical protein